MLPLENITVGSLLRRSAALYANRPAVICHDTVCTYRELDAAVDRFAAALISAGISHGDHVGLFGEIEKESLALFFAVQRIGAVAVLLNTALVAEELVSLIRLSDVKLLCVGQLYGRDRSPVIQRLTPLLDAVRIVSISSSGGCQPLPDPLPIHCSQLREREAAVVPTDTATIIFTSGSTGLPKAVMTSHFSRVNSGIQQGSDFETSCEDVFCVTIPMFHCFCVSANILAALAFGACLCIPKDRHTISILTAVQKYRCTILHSVPSMFRAVMARPDFGSWDLSSLRVGIIGGSGYPPEDFARIEDGFGMTLLSSLGQTEATAGFTIGRSSDSREKRTFTVGRFMDHVEGKIVDAKTGRALPPGETGEICIRGYLVMQGFYKQPDATAHAIDKDGFLHTGDLGAMDEDGYLVMKGRIKELIIRGGENISPSEIETEFARFPQVSVSKVIGIPDRHYGEEACACIVLNRKAKLSEEEIREALKEKLAPYKIPKYILFFDRFPLNATGKIKIKELTEAAQKRLNLL